MDYYYTKDELYHHGILGQKWGVRRFQNPDGTLTEEGKRRYKVDPKTGKYVKRSGRERKAYDAKVKAAKLAAAVKKNKSPRGKNISELTDKQLDKYITRMANEKRALELRADIYRLDPKPVSAGEKFIKNLWSKTLEPVIYERGKDYLNKLIKDAMNASDNEKKKAEEKKQKDLDNAKYNSVYWTNLANAERQKQEYEKLRKKMSNSNGK